MNNNKGYRKISDRFNRENDPIWFIVQNGYEYTVLARDRY